MAVPCAVLDTNVLVAALLGKGAPATIYARFRSGAFWLVSSKALIAELAEVLLRPELAIPRTEVRTLFRVLRHRALIVRSTPRLNACRGVSIVTPANFLGHLLT